ncbi:MAG: hypothetical protein WC652_01240 [archaeon]
MDNKAFALTLLGIIALLGTFVYSYFYPTTTFFADLPFTLTTLTYFISGIAFFGYVTFIPSILFGLQLGAEKNAAIFLYIIPSVIVTYAGAKLGFMLQRDFFNKKNLFKEGKSILVLFFVAIIIAIAIEAALPTIIQFWPKDYLGLNVIQGKDSAAAITDFSGRFKEFSRFIRR